MTSPNDRSATVRRWTIGALATALLGGLLLATAAAPAASAATVSTVSAAQAVPEGLSIAITDGKAETVSGASTTYTVTVTNRGTEPVTGELVVAVPSFVTVEKAEGSHLDKAEAAWTVTVAPGATERRRAAVTIRNIPATEVRVNTLATLYDSADRSRILVRATDAKAIRGVTDPAHTVGQKPATVRSATNDPMVIVIAVSAGAVALAVAVVGAVVFRRRRGGATTGS